MITVRAETDRWGGIEVIPVSLRWARRFRDAATRNGGPRSLSVYFQGDTASEFTETDVPKHLRDDLSDGWPVTWRVDPWTVGHWYGYDAHEAAQ